MTFYLLSKFLGVLFLKMMYVTWRTLKWDNQMYRNYQIRLKSKYVLIIDIFKNYCKNKGFFKKVKGFINILLQEV